MYETDPLNLLGENNVGSHVQSSTRKSCMLKKRGLVTGHSQARSRAADRGIDSSSC